MSSSTDTNAVKAEQVEQMFGKVAPRYDLLNDLLSFGIHRRWRRKVARWALRHHPSMILDCACGTGDLTFVLEKRSGHAQLRGCDTCEPMLEVAKTKALRRGSKVAFGVGDCLDLPVDTGRFALATIAFGIRNVADPAKGVAEMARAVAPGGKVVVLEFGQPTGLVGWVYRSYSRWVIPWLGRRFSGAPEAYDYLPETAAAFPSGEAFVKLMRDTGKFVRVEKKSLSGGIAWYYEGVVA